MKKAGTLHAAVHGVTKSQTGLSDWTTTIFYVFPWWSLLFPSFCFLLCPYLSNFFRWKFQLIIWKFSYFLRYAYVAINFPLRIAFPASHRNFESCFYFHLTWDIFWFLLWFIHWSTGFFFLVAYCLVFVCFFHFPSSQFLVSFCCGQKNCL